VARLWQKGSAQLGAMTAFTLPHETGDFSNGYAIGPIPASTLKFVREQLKLPANRSSGRGGTYEYFTIRMSILP
jgi:hypothetical protein